MAVVGINLGSTRLGHRLKDGGACIVDEAGPVVAIAEERLSRVKHDGGFTRALDYCLEVARLDQSAVELCVATSCCEPIRAANSISELHAENMTVIAVGHHEAHAYSAFWPSPFQEALVIVLDAGGNTLSGNANLNWWAVAREQASYYVGSGEDLKLIGRDFDRPFEVGFGEMFRAFTHYLGWPSSTLAGNTMALAALGDPTAITEPIWKLQKDRLVSPIEMGDPNQAIELVSGLLRGVASKNPAPRPVGHAFTKEHFDLAAWIQWSFYIALRSRVESLVRRTGIRNLCLAGGVALNCVAVGQLIADGVVDEVFIQPAAGDTGQCLGGAYIGLRKIGGHRPSIDSGFHTFLGKEYGPRHIRDALKVIEERSKAYHLIEEPREAVSAAARLIAEGRIVAWFAGGSEFGPRALGARSILGDPRDIDVKKRMQSIKGREPFRPFAPSVLENAADRYFSTGASPYMTVAVTVNREVCQDIPGVVHADGSARVQVVRQDGSPIAALLEDFEKNTGHSLVINTSLNLRGQPIAETPNDAVEIFLSSEIDCLFLNGVLAIKELLIMALHTTWLVQPVLAALTGVLAGHVEQVATRFVEVFGYACRVRFMPDHLPQCFGEIKRWGIDGSRAEDRNFLPAEPHSICRGPNLIVANHLSSE